MITSEHSAESTLFKSRLGKGMGVKRGHNRDIFIQEKSLKILFSRTTYTENFRFTCT
jgi:hypothetical protein